MRRRKIDSRRISSRRPTVSIKESTSAVNFADSVKKFADEYLRGALEVERVGTSSAIINLSLRDAAYMLRLMVEYGGEESVLKTTVTIKENFVIDTEFPSGLPSIEELTLIAKAARSAGFFFEIRGNRVIVRAPLSMGSVSTVYANDDYRIVSLFLDVFFI